MSDWYSRAKKGLQGIYDDTYESMSDLQRQREAGDLSYTESSVRQLGEVAGGVGSLVDAGLSVIPGYEKLQETIGEGVQSFLETDVGQRFARYPQQRPRVAGMLGAAANIAEFVPGVKAVSTVRNAASDVNMLTGPESGKGMSLASLNNVIPGYYGPDKAASAATWFPAQAGNTVRDMLSPTSRAKYREQGITNTTQDIIKRAAGRQSEARKDAFSKIQNSLLSLPGMKKVRETVEGFGGEPTGPHRAAAQVQYTSRIHSQAGRKGKTDLIQEVMRRSDLVDAVSYYPGAYADLIKTNKLKPYPLDEAGKRRKRPEHISNEDLDFIETHFSTVWEEPDLKNKGASVPFRDSDSSILVIKNPGVGKAATGRHHMDVLVHAPFVTKLKPIFNGREQVPADELFEKLSVAAEKTHQLPKDQARFKFYIKGQAKDGSVWVTGSRPGSAITEGGINYLAKVKPDGKVIGIMSDEHNLFETAAGKVQEKTKGAVPALSALKKTLPNRLVAVTPPMVRDMVNYWKKEGKKEKTHEHPKRQKDDRTYEELFQEITDYEPSKAVLEAEQRRQRGMLLGGLGQPAATMVGNIEEEEAN